MSTALRLALCAASMLVWAGAGFADPWKDESDKGRQISGYAAMDPGPEGTLEAGSPDEDVPFTPEVIPAAQIYGLEEGEEVYGSEDTVDIPPGHLPPPGKCRMWYPNQPPGQQPPPYRC